MPSGRRGAGVRVVLDTNVVLAALIWDGPPERLLELAVSGEIALFSSAVLIDELAGVLERRKFMAALTSRDRTSAFLTRRYGAITTLVEPMPVGGAVPADADDDHVIGAALGARADAIATGDRHPAGAGSVPRSSDSRSSSSTGARDVEGRRNGWVIEAQTNRGFRSGP